MNFPPGAPFGGGRVPFSTHPAAPSQTQYGAPPIINPPPRPGQFSAAPLMHATPILSAPAPLAQPTMYIPSPMDKLTTVFVGSITEGVYDAWMERLLRTCGVVRNWKRVTDSNARPKGFGFCVYDSAESVLRALRVLGGEGGDSGGIELPSLDADHPSKKLLLKVDAVARRHVEEYKAAMTRTNNDEVVARAEKMALDEVAQVLKEMKSQSAETFLNSIIPAAVDKPKVESSLLLPSSGNPLDDLPEDMPAEEREKVSKEISLFRERSAAKDREKREREEKLEERRRQELREREKEREREGERRFHDDRRAGNRRETVEDVDEEELKRRQERREREAAQAYIERENRYLNREAQRLRALHGYQAKLEEMEAKRARDREGMRKRLEEWDDDVEKTRGVEEFYTDRQRWVSRRQPFLQRETEADNRDRAAEEEELARMVPDVDRLEEERRRKEEEKVMQQAREREEEVKQRAEEVYPAPSGSGFVVSRIMTVDERKKAIENLVKSIPAEKSALAAWDIKWQYIDKALIDSKLRPFVSKKVAEVLGGEDKDLTDFVAQAMKKHMPSDKLIEELVEALDEEAEILVMKLWRMVIFESEARAMGIA
ncbi:hypothetical protein HDU67_003192 [Dinochytrium kinnereticum]|nr:hypothetical protein HDU67_003192 [Dinochytrium kinnereticum]